MDIRKQNIMKSLTFDLSNEEFVFVNIFYVPNLLYDPIIRLTPRKYLNFLT